MSDVANELLYCVICGDELVGLPDDQPDWPTGPMCGECYQAREMDNDIWASERRRGGGELMTTPAALPEPAVVQQTAVRLGTATFGGYYRVTVRSFMVSIVAVALAFGVGLATNGWVVSVGIGLAVLLTGLVFALWPYTNGQFRDAAELFSDHNCHERAEWKQRTGTKMPVGRKAAERWLVENPTARGRASLLLPLGRVAEADQLIASFVPATPDDEFDVALLHETRALLLGETPDTERLKAALNTLPDPRERRHRRECIALLEAQAAVAASKDPTAVLAAARHQIDGVYWRYRTAWALGIFVAGAVALVTVAGFLAASIGLGIFA